ncbi:MAG TPA: hypothetical protein VEL52_07765 [Candidatus Bathyarchaeia archaeon]|nr:hypothetical protein [Candidatus Bathyarchaeia archaeon]
MVWLLVLAILSGVVVVHARAETISIGVARDSVTVQMNLVLEENLTDLPSVNAFLGSANSTTVMQAFSEPINGSIQELVPNARLSSLALAVRTSNQTGIWTLYENYTMTVIGANTNSGSNIRSNLRFIAMKMIESLQLGGIEVNNVGTALILPALQGKVALYPNLQFYIDGSHPTTAFIPEQTTTQFSILDFTWVTPVSTWTTNSNVLGQFTTWTLDPASSQYNLTLGVPSPEGPFLKTFIAIYEPSLIITAPPNAWVDGYTVSFDTSTPAETLMPSVIVASLIVVLGAMGLDRKLTGPLRLRKKR